MAITIRIFIVAAAFAAIPTGCLAAALGGKSTVAVVPGQQFSGSIKDIPGGGHFILAHGDREFDVVLSDFDAPRLGENGDEKFIEALNRIIYPPIFCDTDRVESDAIYARCFVENRMSLSNLLRQWGVPERSNKH